MFMPRSRTFLVMLTMSLGLLSLVAPSAFSQNAQATSHKVESKAATVIAQPEAATVCSEADSPATVEPTRAAATKPSPVFSIKPSRFDPPPDATPAAPRPVAVDAHQSPPQQSQQQQPQATPTPPVAFTPLTPAEKMRHAARSAFLSPRAYLFPGVSAIITEATEDDLPHKETGDRIADGLSRFAIKFGTRSTRVLLGVGVFPVLFKQDVRYFRSTDKGFGKRTLYAVSRVFVTTSDEGQLQPHYSRFAGTFAASAISNIWEQSTPGRDRIGFDATFKRFGSSFVSDAVFNVFNEFLPDLKKIFKK